MGRPMGHDYVPAVYNRLYNVPCIWIYSLNIPSCSGFSGSSGSSGTSRTNRTIGTTGTTGTAYITVYLYTWDII